MLDILKLKEESPEDFAKSMLLADLALKELKKDSDRGLTKLKKKWQVTDPDLIVWIMTGDGLWERAKNTARVYELVIEMLKKAEST